MLVTGFRMKMIEQLIALRRQNRDNGFYIFDERNKRESQQLRKYPFIVVYSKYRLNLAVLPNFVSTLETTNC